MIAAPSSNRLERDCLHGKGFESILSLQRCASTLSSELSCVRVPPCAHHVRTVSLQERIIPPALSLYPLLCRHRMRDTHTRPLYTHTRGSLALQGIEDRRNGPKVIQQMSLTLVTLSLRCTEVCVCVCVCVCVRANPPTQKPKLERGPNIRHRRSTDTTICTRVCAS